MHRYLIWLGIFALLVAPGCGDGQPSSDEEPENGGEVVASVLPTSPPPPSSPAPPPPPPPPGGATAAPAPAADGAESPESQPGRSPDEVDMIHNVDSQEVAEDYSAEDESVEKLNKIGEAMLAYHKRYKNFPPAAHFGEGNKPLLSWRVLLLPYLDEGDLYDQFDMNEPWDGPTNRPLVDQIPDVYKTPDARPPETCYLVPKGMGTIFSAREGLAKGAIRDGLENTLLVVEADLAKSATWTAPQELQFVQGSPSAGLGNFRNDLFLAVTADGVARRLPSELNADLMRALFTTNGNESVKVAGLELKPGEGVAAGGANLLGQAKNAMRDLQEQDGLRFLMAEAVVHENQQVLGSLRWSKALKRPMLICRWGIALVANVKIIDDDMNVLRRAVGEPVAGPIQKRIAKEKFGEWFAELADVADELLPPLEGETKATGPRQEPGIVLAGQVGADQVQTEAKKKGIDLMLVAKLAPKSFPGRRVQPALVFRLHDVQKDTVLYESKPLRVTQVLMAIHHGEAVVNPIDELIEDFLMYVDTNICLGDMPNFTKPQVQSRARFLVSRKHKNPLPALMELRYYAWKELITPDQLTKCYSLLVGEVNGPILASGDTAERLKIVKQWLPKPKPAFALPAKKKGTGKKPKADKP